jgi:diaminopimelate epimerase
VDGPPAQTDGLVRPHLVGTTIYKMTGSGNDFIMVDSRHTTPADWSVDDIRAVCARGTGVGADGLVFVGPGSEPGGSGEGPDLVRMIYFNSDGSRAAMCGNAALCSTRLAARLGLANPQRMTLETDAATYESRCAPDGERAELHLAPVRAPAPVPGLATAAGERQVALGTVGVPHLVVLVEDVEPVDVVTRGRILRSHPALGPAGANVNFISPTARASEWRMRTYERGVEDETLACGTGAVAAACALANWGLAQLPITFWTRSAKPLEIRARKTSAGLYDDVWLGGEARLVVRGVIN